MSTAPSPEAHIPAAKFKAKCLQLINEAHEIRQGVVITKRGVPMARLVPFEEVKKPFRSFVGRSPGLVVPSQEDWKKVKDDWTKEWSHSTESLSEMLVSPKAKKHGKK